jgi:hypothetical protein
MFAAGKTNITNDIKVVKNFENNQKIDKSMVVNSLSKIFNNIANDVIQANTAIASNAVGASNTLFISGVKCDTVRISGNKQLSSADVEFKVKTQQDNISKVSTEIVTNINKTIEKIGSTDLAKLQASNTKLLNDFMGSMPGYDPTSAHKMAGGCSGSSLISIGSNCSVNSSYDLNSTLKQKLDLDESFKITDPDDISTDIKNKITQSNMASCVANTSAQNSIIIQDIICTVSNGSNGSNGSKKGGTFEFEDNEQKAVAKLYMECVFNQSSISDIATKIFNTISKRYNQIYDAVEKRAQVKGPEYYKKAADLVDTLAAAGMEQINAAAGNLPPELNPTPTQPTNPVQQAQPTQPVQPTNPVQPSQSIMSILNPTPTQPVQPTNPVQQAQPTNPVHPTQPANPVQQAQPTNPVQPTQPSQSIMSILNPTPTQQAQPTQQTQPTHQTQSNIESSSSDSNQLRLWLIIGGSVGLGLVILIGILLMIKTFE